nr:putative RNA recognition motif 2, nucleotide-binding alpha-beta plait domain protein [Tanacetum cinerariifolium]
TGPRNHVVPNQREILKLDPSDHVSTSVMIRNIPNNYTRKLLVKFLEDHCKTQNEMMGNDEKSAFDFVYLPIDFSFATFVMTIIVIIEPMNI